MKYFSFMMALLLSFTMFSPVVIADNHTPFDIEVDSTDESPATPTNQEINEICDNGGIVIGEEGCTEPEGDTGGVLGLIDRVIGLLTILVGAIATVVIVISGIMFTTSGGDPAGLKRARNAIIYAVIALAITLVARLIVSFVIGRV